MERYRIQCHGFVLRIDSQNDVLIERNAFVTDFRIERNDSSIYKRTFTRLRLKTFVFRREFSFRIPVLSILVRIFFMEVRTILLTILLI